MPGPVPDHLLRLRRYAHLGPDDGACLMELVAVLADSRFTDQPTCTHPLLAAVARGVNDATSDAARPTLARLAPHLIDLNPRDPAATIAIVDTCLTAALTVAPNSVALRWHVRRNHRRAAYAARLHDTGFARITDHIWRRGPARHAVERALRTLAVLPDADTLLRRVLTDCVTVARRYESQGEPVSSRLAHGLQRRLPAQSRSSREHDQALTGCITR